MIPRSSTWNPAQYRSLSSSALIKVTVFVAVLLPNCGVQSFFHSQENVIAPINSAGLLINQLLVNTANVSSLLDQNLDHIKPHSPADYPSIEERSDYGHFDRDYEVRAALIAGLEEFSVAADERW